MSAAFGAEGRFTLRVLGGMVGTCVLGLGLGWAIGGSAEPWGLRVYAHDTQVMRLDAKVIRLEAQIAHEAQVREHLEARLRALLCRVAALETVAREARLLARPLAVCDDLP